MDNGTWAAVAAVAAAVGTAIGAVSGSIATVLVSRHKAVAAVEIAETKAVPDVQAAINTAVAELVEHYKTALAEQAGEARVMREEIQYLRAASTAQHHQIEQLNREIAGLNHDVAVLTAELKMRGIKLPPLGRERGVIMTDLAGSSSPA